MRSDKQISKLNEETRKAMDYFAGLVMAKFADKNWTEVAGFFGLSLGTAAEGSPRAMQNQILAMREACNYAYELAGEMISARSEAVEELLPEEDQDEP